MSNLDSKGKSVAVVVNSCDAYSDLWDLFFLCLSDYWPGCNYLIVLNTESKNYLLPASMSFDVAVHNHKLKEKDLWGARLIATLKDITADFVIMLYDDFLLNAPVNKKRIKASVDLISSNPEIDVVYLTKLLGVKKSPARDDGLAMVEPKADYRLNSAPAIWRKEALMKYTGVKDNPWAWEYFGSYRTFDTHSIFLAIADSGEDIYPYDYRKGGAIYRQKWVSEVIDPIIRKHNLDIDVEKRGTVAASCFPKRDFAWKVSFMATGFEMIGLRISYALYRIIKNKLFPT